MSTQRDTEQMQQSFTSLIAVIEKLRGEDGCPWDRAQTHHSLQEYLIEEVYEVIDAIDANDMHALCEELGDVLFQVVFHAQVASEAGHFSINNVIQTLTDKLIRRHPHVFGDRHVESAEQVLEVWQAVKEQENAARSQIESRQSLMDGIPRQLPALMYAKATGERAARVGFDWPDAAAVWAKVLEEQDELNRAVQDVHLAAEPSDQMIANVEEEWGDLVFSLVNLARHLKIEPEKALRQANHKFEARFRTIEARAEQQGMPLGDQSLDDMNALWDEAKRRSKLGPS